MEKLTYKNHLRNTGIICIVMYICISITQKNFLISEYTDGGAYVLGCAIFAVNACYYILRYLEGDFSYREDR